MDVGGFLGTPGEQSRRTVSAPRLVKHATKDYLVSLQRAPVCPLFCLPTSILSKRNSCSLSLSPSFPISPFLVDWPVWDSKSGVRGPFAGVPDHAPCQAAPLGGNFPGRFDQRLISRYFCNLQPGSGLPCTFR